MSGHLDDVEHPLQVPEVCGVAGGKAEAVPLGGGGDQQVEPPQPGVVTGGPDQVRQQTVGLRRRDVERDDVERVDDELLPPPAPLPLDGVGRGTDPVLQLRDGDRADGDEVGKSTRALTAAARSPPTCRAVPAVHRRGHRARPRSQGSMGWPSPKSS